MGRTCRDCGAEIPPASGRGRPRARCADCSPPEKRKPVAEPTQVMQLPPQPPSQGEPGLVAAYRDQLDERGVLDTPEGAQVLHLATLLQAGPHTASGAAALSRELRAAAEAALRHAAPAADRFDEIAARRAAKAAGA